MHKINPSEFQGAEYGRRAHLASVSGKVTLDDLMAPEYWGPVILGRVGFGDHIEVMATDGSYNMEFVVLDVGKTWAKVGLLRNTQFNKKSLTAAVMNAVDSDIVHSAGDTYVKWSTPTTKYRVHDVKTRVVLKDGFITLEAAKSWADAYSTPTGAQASGKV